MRSGHQHGIQQMDLKMGFTLVFRSHLVMEASMLKIWLGGTTIEGHLPTGVLPVLNSLPNLRNLQGDLRLQVIYIVLKVPDQVIKDRPELIQTKRHGHVTSCHETDHSMEMLI